MADVFAADGYQTGIFGKWHLGDGYPFRPGDRGFHKSRLTELGLDENTLVIFMTDNGSAAGTAKPAKEGGWAGFNAGMREQKGSQYEGGHRVPFFMRVPKSVGRLAGESREIGRLAAHFD